MSADTKKRPARQPQLSGWCAKWSPKASHARCAGGNAANPDKEWQPCPCECHGDEHLLKILETAPEEVEEIDPDEIDPDEIEEDEYECGECGEQVIEREDGVWVHYFTDEEECG